MHISLDRNILIARSISNKQLTQATISSNGENNGVTIICIKNDGMRAWLTIRPVGSVYKISCKQITGVKPKEFTDTATSRYMLNEKCNMLVNKTFEDLNSRQDITYQRYVNSNIPCLVMYSEHDQFLNQYYKSDKEKTAVIAWCKNTPVGMILSYTNDKILYLAIAEGYDTETIKQGLQERILYKNKLDVESF